MDALSLSLLVKFKRHEYDLPEPDVHNIYVVFEIRECRLAKESVLEEAHGVEANPQDISGSEMEIPTKEVSKAEELSQNPFVDEFAIHTGIQLDQYAHTIPTVAQAHPSPSPQLNKDRYDKLPEVLLSL